MVAPNQFYQFSGVLRSIKNSKLSNAYGKNDVLIITVVWMETKPTKTKKNIGFACAQRRFPWVCGGTDSTTTRAIQRTQWDWTYRVVGCCSDCTETVNVRRHWKGGHIWERHHNHCCCCAAVRMARGASAVRTTCALCVKCSEAGRTADTCNHHQCALRGHTYVTARKFTFPMLVATQCYAFVG